MKRYKNIIIILVGSVLLILLAGLNLKYSFISAPIDDEMIGRQIDFVTISTVFAGFSFTALGILLGMSSEKLIERIKSTNIIMDKASRIMISIVFFVLSVLVSLFLILGLDKSFVSASDAQRVLDNMLYVIGVGYMILGIVFFAFSVYELYDLVKRVYSYNKDQHKQQFANAKKEMENTMKKMKEE